MNANRPWVNLSISPCDEAAALGFDHHAFNRVTVRAAEFLLFHGFNVSFGHDWRPDGVMRAVAELAETAASGQRLNELHGTGAHMLNLVPGFTSGLTVEAVETAAAAGNVLRVHAVQSLSAAKSRKDLFETDNEADVKRLLRLLRSCPDDVKSVCELWVLRHALSVLHPQGCRICIGGKTDGYSGMYPGVAEEAMLALRRGLPLYLVGGFGGAAKAVADALVGAESGDAECLKPNGGATLTEHRKVAAFANAVEMPLDGMSGALRKIGMKGLSRNNGLSSTLNKRLFACTDVEQALGLVMRGLASVKAGHSAGS